MTSPPKRIETEFSKTVGKRDGINHLISKEF